MGGAFVHSAEGVVAAPCAHVWRSVSCSSAPLNALTAQRLRPQPFTPHPRRFSSPTHETCCRSKTLLCTAAGFQNSSTGALCLGSDLLEKSTIETSSEAASYTAEVSEEACAPSASLTRAIYSSVQPARVASRGAGGRGSGGRLSPMSSLAIFLLTVSTGVAAAIRARVRAVRECNSCHGYGVQRCKLCSGKGTIEWEGKMAHREPCPMCLGRRFSKCTCCGGAPILARNLFSHKAKRGDALLLDLIDPSPSKGKAGRLSKLAEVIPPSLRLPKRERPERDNKMELSDLFAEEVMTD